MLFELLDSDGNVVDYLDKDPIELAELSLAQDLADMYGGLPFRIMDLSGKFYLYCFWINSDFVGMAGRGDKGLVIRDILFPDLEAKCFLYPDELERLMCNKYADIKEKYTSVTL